MERELISVIIPIYNVEPYLEKCINSIVNQTYSKLEIILVNDGSTDNCLKICKKYQDRDSRIIVVNKKNGGLSDARNCGIQKARGNYLFFVDSDDYVNINIINLLYNDLINGKCDISCCLFKKINENEIIDDDNILNKKRKVYNSHDAIEKLLYQKGLTNSAWGKLYKKELFDSIKFPVGDICEDLAIMYKLFALSNKISVNKSQYYYYLQRSDSIINSSFNEKRMVGLEFAKRQKEFIDSLYCDLTRATSNRLFMEAIYIQKKIKHCNNVNNKEIESVLEIINKYKIDVFFDNKSKIKYRLYALAALINVNII